MNRLVTVELGRYWSRRAVRLVGVLALLAIAAAGVIVFVNSDRSSEALEAARRERETQVRLCLESLRQGEPLPPGDTPEEFCRERGAPPVESFDPRFHLTSLSGVLKGTSVPLIILGLALGASFIGAEWGSGTVATLLTWEARRTRVLVAKVVAGAAFVFAAAVLLQVLLGAALVPAAALRGSTAGVDGQWATSTAGVVARGAAVAAMASGIGFAIASVARNTTAALVIGFVYLAVLENIVRSLRPGWSRWLLGDNAAAFVAGPDVASAMQNSVGRAGVVILVYAVTLAALAVAFFNRRDVT